MSSLVTLELLSLLALVLVSALLTGAEAAYFSLGRARLKRLAEQNAPVDPSVRFGWGGFARPIRGPGLGVGGRRQPGVDADRRHVENPGNVIHGRARQPAALLAPVGESGCTMAQLGSAAAATGRVRSRIVPATRWPACSRRSDRAGCR